MSLEQYGRHRIRHGDITDPGAIAQLMQGERAGMMYSDPPWGAGNIKYWSKVNLRHNGVENEPVTLDAFLGAVFGAARDHVDGYMLIEYGIGWRKNVMAAGIAAGFSHCGVVDLMYRSGSRMMPLDLHLFARPGWAFPPGYGGSIHLTHGYTTLKEAFFPLAEVLKAKGQPIALDPCCGMGYTAQACVDTGLSFRGNELNRKRLEKTIARLVKDAKVNA